MDTDKIKSFIINLLTKNPEGYILNKIKDLIKKPPLQIDRLIKTVPKSPGVYLIYNRVHKKEDFIYVGETDDLSRRLKGDISRGKRRYHTFLKMISSESTSENKIKEIIRNDYLFSYILTESKESAFIIEGILIRTYYKNLCNKIKKYQKLVN